MIDIIYKPWSSCVKNKGDGHKNQIPTAMYLQGCIGENLVKFWILFKMTNYERNKQIFRLKISRIMFMTCHLS